MAVRMLADAILVQLSLALALATRMLYMLAFYNVAQVSELSEEFHDHLRMYTEAAWPLTLVILGMFSISGIYTYGRFYQGRYRALTVIQAVTQSYLIFAVVQYFFGGKLEFSRPGLVLAWGFSVVLMVGARLWSRMLEKVVHPEREAMFHADRGKGRKVLVIGGAGYIGSALLPKLLDKGYQVRLLDMLLFGTEPIDKVIGHPNLEIVQGDFRHVDKVVEAMQGCDSVVHLGAIVGDPACDLDHDLTIEVNLTATRMVAEVAKLYGVKYFVFASTCSVYGACDEMLDERSFVKPISLYGNTKLAAERVLRGMATDTFAPTILRFSTIYGLSGRTRFDLVVNLLTAKAKIEGKITVNGGDQWRPFVHVDDAALAVATVLDAPRPIVGNEIFNVGSNEQNYTIQQIGELVHKHVFSAELITSTDNPDKRNYKVDFSKIRNTLGYTPKWTVEQGIQQVIDAVASGAVSDYREPRYSNVKFLTEAAGQSRLVQSNWARELINVITTQTPESAPGSSS